MMGRRFIDAIHVNQRLDARDRRFQRAAELTRLMADEQPVRRFCACGCGRLLDPTATRKDGHPTSFIHGHNASLGYHGHGKPRTPTFISWMQMRQRCRNVKHHAWASYGGRGIAICDRWNDFKAFLADMGERPDGTSLDRIDNDGNYEPANCRWATKSEQRSNIGPPSPAMLRGLAKARATRWGHPLPPDERKLVSVCAYCPDAQEQTANARAHGYDISHGLCESCRVKVEAEWDA